MTKKTDWLEALQKQKLEVKSARDGLAVKGFLDTGNHALNWAISGYLLGGYPLGHTVEIFGDPSTGKSYVAARAIAMAQKAGGVALLDDTEGAYNLEHINNLGVDADTLALRYSRTVKDHLETARAFVTAFRTLDITAPGILVCDSLSLLSTEHELAVGLDKRDLDKARELKAFFRIIGKDLSELGAVHVSTSHVIANPGNMYNPRTTSGGGGPKFQASVRIDLRGVSKIKNKSGDFIGVICRAYIDKNRVTAPWKEVRFAIPFYQPISRVSGLVPLLLKQGILGTNGKHALTYDGADLGIPAHKSKDSFLKQDESAETLLDQVPEILEAADETMTARRSLAVEGEEDEEEYPEEVEA